MAVRNADTFVPKPNHQLFSRLERMVVDASVFFTITVLGEMETDPMKTHRINDIDSRYETCIISAASL